MTNPGAMSVLRGSPIFRGLAPDLLARLSVLCVNREYARGETIFEEGLPGSKLFGIISGRVLITTSSVEGQDLHLNVVGVGEIVGEIAFLDGGVRTATGRAAEPTVCFELEREPFLRLLDETPALSLHLIQLLCKRVRWMTRLVADSAFLTVPERLATRLRDLAQPTSRGDSEVRMSQSELAEFLGISRQVVNGYLRDWQRQGRIELARGSIRIRDLENPF
jgi:CRP/FNR family transcriptional regulator, cyclic AMP receptor protein